MIGSELGRTGFERGAHGQRVVELQPSNGTARRPDCGQSLERPASGEVSWHDVPDLARGDDRFEGHDAFVHRHDRIGPFYNEEIEEAASDTSNRVLRTAANQLCVTRNSADNRTGESKARGDYDAIAPHFSLLQPPTEHFLGHAEEAV